MVDRLRHPHRLSAKEVESVGFLALALALSSCNAVQAVVDTSHSVIDYRTTPIRASSPSSVDGPGWLSPGQTPTPYPSQELTPGNGSGTKWKGCIEIQDNTKSSYHPRPGIIPANSSSQAFEIANAAGGGNPVREVNGIVFMAFPDGTQGTIDIEKVDWRGVPNGTRFCVPAETAPAPQVLAKAITSLPQPNDSISTPIPKASHSPDPTLVSPGCITVNKGDNGPSVARRVTNGRENVDVTYIYTNDRGETVTSVSKPAFVNLHPEPGSQFCYGPLEEAAVTLPTPDANGCVTAQANTDGSLVYTGPQLITTISGGHPFADVTYVTSDGHSTTHWAAATNKEPRPGDQYCSPSKPAPAPLSPDEEDCITVNYGDSGPRAAGALVNGNLLRMFTPLYLYSSTGEQTTTWASIDKQIREPGRLCATRK